MKKLFALLFVLLLAACSATAPNDIEPTTKPVTADTTTTDTKPDLSLPITPAATAAEAGIARDRDWTQGASDPLITIIEYGDFQ